MISDWNPFRIVITKIGKTHVKSKADYNLIIKDYEPGNIIMLAIKRGNNKLVMAFTISE